MNSIGQCIAYRIGKGNIRLYDFVRTMYEGRNVESIVDVWCEPVTPNKQWKEFADSWLKPEDGQRLVLWGLRFEYWFVLGPYRF